MRALTFTSSTTSILLVASVSTGAFATAGWSANPAAGTYGVMRYPDMGLYRRQSPGGCQDNTVACADFCIAKDEQCCADGTSCLADETCEKGSDGVIGCCAADTVCNGSVPTEDFGPAPTSNGAPDARWKSGPVPTAAAALAVGAFALL